MIFGRTKRKMVRVKEWDQYRLEASGSRLISTAASSDPLPYLSLLHDRFVAYADQYVEL
jgi:hypothetical protein